MDEKKRLCKSRNNKKICGVCAGFADYLNLDPTIVRVLWALLAVFAGTGILAYFISGHALKPLRSFASQVVKVQL